MRVAKSAGGSSIDAATDKGVTFGGQSSVTVPIGQEIDSDAVDFSVAPSSNLAVSTYVSGNRWSFNGIGPNGIGRFSRDVLERSGATRVVALLGINDFGIPSLLGNAAELVTAA